MTRLCILTPHPDYDENWSEPAGHYRALFGEALEFRGWTDAGDLSAFDLVMPLLTWGYQRDPAPWFAALNRWESQGIRFANPVSLLRWNTDKGYLFDLESAGIAIVPTRFAAALSTQDLADAHSIFGSDLVVKPTISGGADGTYRMRTGDPIPADIAGREMLIQPMMAAIATEGEFSLFYFNGDFSHAIVKRPAAGDFRVQEQFGGRDVPADAPVDARALADATLGVLPALPLYARVDMVRGGDALFRLMELEVIEPSLFLGAAADKGAQFAKAVGKGAASAQATLPRLTVQDASSYFPPA
jgi:glutathione synthase/RimK-type ligase-like ATP-grasp enzyme